MTSAARRQWPVIAAAWALSVGFDFLLHAGLLANMYVEAGPFLLPPREAFRRIPLGYMAFLALTLALDALFRRLGVRGARAGFRQGARVGVVVWGAFSLGLYSISTAPLPLLLGWWTGQALELGLAGAVLGAAAAGMPTRRLWARVALAILTCIVVTVALQVLGWARPMETV